MIVIDRLPVPPGEPAWGAKVVLPSGRTFVRRVDHDDFHWADGVGWYRWREVHGRMQREGGWIELPEEKP